MYWIFRSWANFAVGPESGASLVLGGRGNEYRVVPVTAAALEGAIDPMIPALQGKSAAALAAT